MFGRRKAIFIGCTILSIGAVLQASAFGLPQFIAGRVIAGVGTGINTATVPVWQAECIKVHRRGQIMAFETSLVIAGVMVSYWIDFGISFVDPNPVAWRFPIAFQLVFSLIIMATIMSLPESPRWLMLKSRHEEATAAVSALYDLPPDDSTLKDELNAMSTTLEISKGSGISQIFSNGPLQNFTRTSIALSIQILSQLTGINIITYYAASIYENEIGLSPFMSRVLAACNGTEYFIASMFAPTLVKHMKRRSLLVLVSSGLCFSMVVLAILIRIKGEKAGIAAAVFLFVFNTFFGIGYAQISWIYPAEITPLSIRGPVNALSTSSNWIFNFMVVMVTPIAFTNIGWKTYVVFAVLNAMAIPIYLVFYPETSGRSLEEIDLIFSSSTNIFEAVKLSKTMENHFDKKGNMVKSLASHVEEAKALQGGSVQHAEIHDKA